MNDLKERYSKLSDNELLVMVYYEESNYTEEAVKIARSILDKRGLGQPSSEILQQGKNYHNQIKESQKDQFIEAIQSEDIFKFRELKQASKEKNYYFIGKWSFWCIIGYGVLSGLDIGGVKAKWTDLIPFHEIIKSGRLFILEVIFNIAILGIFSVVFFIKYSLNLSREQRKEQGLSLFMPKYIFFIYGISLLFLVVLVILPRL